MNDCIFCRIVEGEAPADFVYQDEELVAFKDIYPRAPVHILIIPFAHVAALGSEPAEHLQTLGSLFNAGATLAKQFNVNERGYRLVVNQGPDSGQEVPHLHMHLLAGRSLSAMG